MFGFLNFVTETSFMKCLGILLFIWLGFTYSDIMIWFEGSFLGQALITEGLWPYDPARKFLTVGAFFMITSLLIWAAMFFFYVIYTFVLFIVGALSAFWMGCFHDPDNLDERAKMLKDVYGFEIYKEEYLTKRREQLNKKRKRARAN